MTLKSEQPCGADEATIGCETRLDKTTKNYLNEIIKSIYTEVPKSVKSGKEKNICVVSSKTHAIFSNDGKMVTVYP